MAAFKRALKDSGVLPQSINAYYRSWRVFYDWCEEATIVCMIEFPPKIQGPSNYHSSKSIVAPSRHTGRADKSDPGLEPEVHILDYKDVVLSNDEYARLSAALTEIDPVYDLIAFMMVTTGLRIGGVVQVPLGSDTRNPGWLRYPELKATGVTFQKLTYVPKGKKHLLRCSVLTESLKRLHTEYIAGHRKERLKLFAQRFPGKTPPLWLTAVGKPVEFHDIWNAFRDASSVVGRRITPHHLRHTYATYVVYHYFKAHGLKPNLAYGHDIHEALRIQLGHMDIEVTKRYIRTVIRTEADAWLPVLTPHVNQVVQENTPAHVLASVVKFFESKPAH
ncbi:tyrosine-type recombinase/integrase [Pseudomonas sp. CP4]|uniref:tyrosine-type recombinase/integrase n=1 Tax=Pseudomonas sp. CP4 TaxID=3388844 RepID=UPI0039EFBBBD